MKNKGYTLLELLGVIVILSVLITLVFPSIINFIKKGNDKIDSITNDLIINAAGSYINDNSSKLYLTSGEEYCVSVDTLIGKDYLDESLIEKNLYASKSIKITYTDKYNYEITDTDTCMYMEPGLYDKNNNLLLSWDELVNKYDFEKAVINGNYEAAKIIDSIDSASKLVLDNTITSIGASAFSGCKNLTKITIPSSVTNMGWYAFYECANLKTVTIAEGITHIGEATFDGCTSLTSITIPSSVTSIGHNAFENCSNLESIKVDSNNPVYDSRNNSNAIIETATNTLIFGCKNTIIPNGITSINSGAFNGIPIKNITIPSSVTNIDVDSFYNSPNLESIKVDSNNPVYDSRDNSNAIIETSTNTLMLGSKNTIIPNSVTGIGVLAFRGNKTLGSITIPDSVTWIGSDTFIESSITSITIPNSVITIYGNPFSGCKNLTTIYYKGTATGAPWGAPNATVISK